jgi:hypothetical protein
MGINEETARSSSDGIAYGTLLEDLIGLQSREEFLSLIERKPAVLGSEMLEFLETIAAHEGRGILLRRQLRLVKGAQEDPEAAWSEFAERLECDNETSIELCPLVDQINAALAAERPAEAIALAEPAIIRAREAELGLLVAAFEHSAQRVFWC